MKQAREDHLTRQALANQQMSMQDIMNQQAMQQMGRPVSPMGTVTSPGASIPSDIQATSQQGLQAAPTSAPSMTVGGTQIPGLPPGLQPKSQTVQAPPVAPMQQQFGAYPSVLNQPTQQPDYVRKVDKSRLATYTDRFGNKTSAELYTPEEQAQRDAQRQISGMDILAQGQANAQAKVAENKRKLDLAREGGGIPAPAEFSSMGWKPGTPMTQADYRATLEQWADVQHKLQVDAAEGRTLVQMPLPTPFGQAPSSAPTAPTGRSFYVDPATGRKVYGTPQAMDEHPWQQEAATDQPTMPSGAKILFQAPQKPVKLDDQQQFIKDYQAVNDPNSPDRAAAAERLKAHYAYKTDPATAAQLQATREAAQATRAQTHQDLLDRQQTERSDRSYRDSSNKLTAAAKPVNDLAARFGRLEDTLAQNSPQADALVAPELLSVMAGGQGSGIRINEAEISRIVGGRSKWEDLKAAANKWRLDPSKANSITPEQRQQIRALMGAAKQRISAKQQAITDAGNALDNTNDPTEHHKIVTGLNQKLSAADTGGGGQVPHITSRADYDKLPSGTLYTEPDGKTYRKP
jgi:hypothetical protein